MVKKNATVKVGVNSVSVNKPNLDSIIKDIHEKYKKEIVTGIRLALLSSQVHEALSREAISILNEMQAAYWGGASSEVKKDPTQFGLPEQHSKIRAEIFKNLQEASSSVLPDGTITLTPISNAFMMEGTSPEEGIPWMLYFIVGALDNDLLWMSSETYTRLKGETGGATSLGRFGVGHMWHVSGAESKEKMSNWLKSIGLKYNDLQHPQSGKPGRLWFSDLIVKSGITDIITSFAFNYANSKFS